MTHSRRHFLKSSAGFLGAMTFGVPRILRAQTAPARKLLLVTCNGGWDVTFHLDPKPSGVSAVDVPTGSIQTSGNLEWFAADACAGVVNDFFTAHGDVSSIVRGISVRSISHDVCIRRMMTGSPADDAPDLGVIAANAHGPDLPAPYLTLGAVSFPGYLEGSSVRQGVTNQLALAHSEDANTPNDNEQALINNFLKARGQELKNVRGQYGANARKLDDYLASVDRVQGLHDNREALGTPFAISLDLNSQLGDALTMLERGVSWSVTVSTGFVWDHHDPATAPTGTYQGGQGLRNQTLWPALTNLVNELKTRDGSTPGSKMIDETVVVVMSEMTRTPKYNGAGGKDHWPYTSALVLGAGINAGQTLGVTDDTLVSEKIDLATGAADSGGYVLESSNFVAGLLDVLGVDPALHLGYAPPFTALKAA